MAQMMSSACLKLVARIDERDQDAILSRLDELQAQGVPAQKAQIQAAIDVLAKLQRQAGIKPGEEEDADSKDSSIKKSQGRSRAGGQVADSNGFFYKGGQFLPTTSAEPGKWKVNKKWVTSGRELVAPGELAYQPTPFSRSLFTIAGVGYMTRVQDGRLELNPGANGNGVRDYQGNTVTRDTEITPGVKGVMGKESLTLGEIIDAWNGGQRWFDVKPDADVLTTDIKKSTPRKVATQPFVEVVRGNDLYFPKGNENGEYYEPLWIAKFDGKSEHGRTPDEARKNFFARFGESISRDVTHTPEFKDWSEGAPVVHLGERHEFKSGQPVVVEALHGTTNSDLTEFKRERANVESDWGAGFYASNTPGDVATNYANNEGADLTQRIELMAERLAANEFDDDMEAAREEAKRRLTDGSPNTMKLYVRMSNPAVQGGKGETFFDYTEEYDEETDSYTEPTGKLVDFVESLRNVAYDFDDVDVDGAMIKVWERADGDGIGLTDLVNILKSTDSMSHASDRNGGDNATNEVIRRALEGMGFDGVIDTTVYDKFGPKMRRNGQVYDRSGGMKGMDEDTVHFIAFDPTQLKSATGNNGQFDPANPDIRKSAERGASIVGTLGSLNEDEDYAAGKGGDFKAAMRTARRIVTNDAKAIIAGIDSPVVVGVVSIEASGRNQVPFAAAAVLANEPGAGLDTDIVQSSSPKRTAMDGLGRIFSRPVFDGSVQPGRNYVLVDDTITQGGTFAALADHIEAGGGNVAAIIALSGKQYSATISADESTISQVRSKFGDVENEFNQATGYDFSQLTQSEARYIANFKPASAVRDRILAEAGKGQRIEGQENTGLLKSSARNPQEDTQEFKDWFGDSKVVDEQGRPLVVYHGTGRDFSTFDNDATQTDDDVPRAGFYFTDDVRYAELFASKHGGNIMPSYLSIRNPADLREGVSAELLKGLSGTGYGRVGELMRSLPEDIWELSDGDRSLIEALDALGYDGLRIKEPEAFQGFPEAWIAFRPEQIKSATGNQGTFDPKNPDIRKSKERTTGDYGREYTPEQRDLFKQMGRTTSKPTIVERLKEARQDIGKKMTQGIADQFAPLKELGNGAYTLARLSKGAAGAFEALLGHGKLKIVDGAYDADMSGGFIDKVGKPLGKDLEDFMTWVAANRADGLMAQDREHLFTEEMVDAGKSLADGDLDFDYLLANGANTRDRRAAYEDALKKFNEFNNNVLDIAEQSGLIDPEARKLWDSEFYVPFYRVSEDDGSFIGGNIKAGLVRQKAFHKLKGGSQKLNSDLLANALQNWSHLIDASAKNRASKATLESAANVGIATEADEETARQMGKVIGKEGGTVWFMDEGKKRHFVVGDPYVLAAINSIEYAGMRGPIMDAMSTMKHWLTIGVTASPAFKVRNLIRDSIQAMSIAELSYNPIKNFKEGVKASARDSQEFVSALASGGLIRFGSMLEGNSAERVRKLIDSGVDPSTILDTPGKVRAAFSRAFNAYEEIGNRGEEINRAALYSQLRKNGMSHSEASLAARDLMDFSLQGTFSTVRFLTQVVPFMNARIQGLYKLGRGASEDPKRFSIVLGAAALASVALLAMYGDDDDWKRREDWDRDGFWWLKFGGTAFRIPKPFEIGAIATIAERGVELFTNDKFTTKMFGDRVLSIMGDNLSMNPIPQAVKPLLSVYANKDSFSGRPIESMGMERLKSEYRYTADTSMIARAASSSLNAATGLVGKEAYSPVQIDSMLRGYFGWLGTFVVAGADMAIRPMTSEPTRPQADYLKVVTQGFLKSLPDSQSKYVSAMYEQAQELERAYATHRQLIKDGKLQEASEFAVDHKEQLERYRRVEAVKKVQSSINEQVHRIERSDMDPAKKREEIQKLRSRSSDSAERIYGL